MVRFVEKTTDEPTWVIKKPDFGRFLPHLYLDMLEIKHKLKPNAPVIPDSTYQGDAFTPEELVMPPPDGGPLPLDERKEETRLVVEDEMESQSHAEMKEKGGTYSDEDEQPYTVEELDVLDRFAETPPNRVSTPSDVETANSTPRYIQTEEPDVQEQDSVEDEEDKYARELVEKRRLTEYLKENNVEFTEADSLKIMRALKEDHEFSLKKKGTLTVNKMVLGVMMWGASEGMEWMDPTLQGYLDYQMKLMPMYEGVLEEFDQMELTDMIMDLPPSAKLAGGIAVSSALFVAMKKYNIEDKLSKSKFLETIIPGYGNAIDNMTKASKETKTSNQGGHGTGQEAGQPKKRRRGPSIPAKDIKKM